MGICILSFSARTHGNCAQIGKLIQSLSEDAVFHDFSSFALHGCGGCDYQCFSEEGACPYLDDMEARLLEDITHSDLTYFVIPNYCDYPCSNYFIFNERSLCCFQRRPDLLDRYEKVPKRAIVVSNTEEENFRKALSYQSYGGVETLFLSAKQFGKTSIRGDLLTEERAVQAITDFVKTPQGEEAVGAGESKRK